MPARQRDALDRELLTRRDIERLFGVSKVRAARLAGLPAGVSVEPGRIEVRFSGAKDAVGRLFALAQALTNDYERFEELVEGGDLAGGGGAVRE